jgi:TRAP transporter TAXI family solute receptor
MYRAILSLYAVMLLCLGGTAQAQTDPAPRAQPQNQQLAAAQPQPQPESVSDRLNSNTVTLISGNPNGTYLYFAYDMSAVLDDGNTLRILPIVGKGAGNNVKDLLYLKGVDMGITQSDILRHFSNTGELGANIAGRLRYIARLYNEEMHVLAGAKVKSIEELSGQKVNFSDAGSGTQISARLIFNALGLKVQEVNMGQADAFEAIKRGEVAATILFGGKPTAAFAKLNASGTSDFRLLSVPYAPGLQEDYLPSSLAGTDYPNLIPEGEVIETIAVGSVLAVFNWAPDSDRYRRVAQFTDALFSKFDKFLEAPRHPKWREVNLSASLTGWQRFGAAQEWLDKNRNAVARSNQLTTSSTSEQPAGSPLNEGNREELFRSFMKWRDNQPAR